jgi:drug/metabolite transporter (DMT)-like permease
MKPWLLAGIVVAALGVFVLARGISYPSHRSVMRVGDLEASVQEQHAVPAWLGVVAVAGGALMIGAGLRGRKT